MRTRAIAFSCGVAVASVMAALLFVIFQPVRDDYEAKRWQIRAEEGERQLAALRMQLQTVSAQLAEVGARREVATQRSAVPAPVREGPPVPMTPAVPLTPLFSARLNPTHPAEWNALVAGTLQSEVQRRLGRALLPEQEQRLLDTLTRLRDASLEVGPEPADPEDPGSMSDQLMRSIVLLEADRVFRDELGIGVSRFLQGLSADQVEEVSPVEQMSADRP